MAQFASALLADRPVFYRVNGKTPFLVNEANKEIDKSEKFGLVAAFASGTTRATSNSRACVSVFGSQRGKTLVARNVVGHRDFDEQRHLDLLVATLDAAVRDRSREHAATRTRRRNENRDAVDSLALFSIDRPRRISDGITSSIGISNTSATPGPIIVPRNYRRSKHSL